MPEKPKFRGHKLAISSEMSKILKKKQKFYPQILSTEVSFAFYDRPPTGINVAASFCA